MNRKNKTAAFAVIALVCALAAALCGCSLFSAGGGTLSVTIDAGGGVLTSKEVYTATAGSDFDLSRLSVPTREGYTFVGWQAGEKIYASDAVIRPSADMTLVALWKKDASTLLLTFDAANGSDAEVFSVRDGESFDLSKPTVPLREGFEFLGWKNGDTVYLKDEPNALVPLDDMTFTAEWRSLKYKISFRNGDAVLSEAEYLYGETPEAPAFGENFPERENVSETKIAVFKGWDREIVPAKSEAVYNAVYETRERLYTLTLASAGVLFTGADGAPIEANYGAHNSLFRFKIGLKEGSRDDGMVVKLNGEALAADADGLYTVTLDRDGLEITVENVDTVAFDVVFSASHSYYSIRKGSDKVNYGDTVEFAAWGAAGYEHEEPYVFVTGESLSLAPYGRDADGKYLFRVENVRRALDVTIGCFPNEYDVTYIDLDGNRLETKYKRLTADYILGVMGDVRDNGFDRVPNGAGSYAAAYGIYNGYDFCRVTKSAERADRLMTKAAYDEWVAAGYPVEPEEPVHGEENVYYIVYYDAPDEPYYYPTFLNVPGGFIPRFYENGQYNDFYLDYDGYEGKLSRFSVEWSLGEMPVKLFGGNGGAYPVFRDADGRTVSPNADGEYVFPIDRASEWNAEVKTHTVTIQDNEDTDYYRVENTGINPFPTTSFQIPDGADFKFYFIFHSAMTDVERDPVTYRNSVLVNGAPCEFYNDPDFYNPMRDGYDLWSGIEPRFHFIVRNVKEDISITWTVPEDKPHTFRFPVGGDYSYTLNGDPVDQSNPLTDGNGKQYIDIPLLLASDDLRIVPKPGYMFEKTSISVKFAYISPTELTDAAGNLTGVGVKRISTTSKTASASAGYRVRLTGFTGSTSWLIETDCDAPGVTDAHRLVSFTAPVVPEYVKATQWKKRSDPTESGASFSVSKLPATAAKDGSFAVTITVPEGRVPAFYVEWADAVSEGFRSVSASTVSGNAYTFTVTNPRCDFRWYILLEADSYQVTFDWGEDSLTLTLPHGTLLSDISLPETFIGERNGVKGKFTVTRWNHADGTRFLLADRSETVTPETDFTAAAASFNGALYYSVSDALNALNATSAGDLDVLMSATGENAGTLRAGTADAPAVYTIPAGVTLKLPFRTDGYGYTLAGQTDAPTVLNAPLSLGVVGLIVPENAVVELYGKLSVGALIGYPRSAYPYQGHISGAHSVLKLDGRLNVRAGGAFECYGFAEGSGSVEAFSGGVVKTSFVVRDYRGGTSSSGVYSENIAPFNVYESPNVLVPVTLGSGAKEVVKAVLYAGDNYNVTEMDVLGGAGIVQPAEGGKIVRATRRVANDRYNDGTKGYEPAYEFRTVIEVYGGGRDGVMSLAGIATTKYCQLGLNFAYDVRLYGGIYSIYNMYKLLPGGKLTVGADATLRIERGEEGTGLITSYAADFQEIQTYPHKQLYYPAIAEAGKLTVDGKLVVYGKLGSDVLTGRAGASIEIYGPSTYLSVAQREGTAFNNNFAVTYSASVKATVNGATELAQGDYYVSGSDGSGGFVWAKD